MRVQVLFSVLTISAGIALAQGSPKADIFVGFSDLNADAAFGVGRDNLYGWQASAAGYVNSRFALVGDFGGHYKAVPSLPNQSGITTIDFSSLEYLFGPRVMFPVKRATPFAHFLAGGVHQSASANGVSASVDGFLLGVGGGVDVAVGKRLAVRVVQFDWLPTRMDGQWQTDGVRLGFGLVLRVGH